MTTYTVTAQRGARRWVLQCVEVPGAISEVARLTQADKVIREAIAFVAEVPESDVQVNVVPVLSGVARDRLTQAERLRAEAVRANAQAAAERRAAARALKDEGLSVREIGKILQVSYQRAQQLVEA